MPVSAPHTYRVRLLFTGDGDVLQNALVTVDHRQVLAINQHAQDAFTDLGNVALLPGLVNCHTHLEFSHLTSPLGRGGQSLPAWIAEVVAHRRARIDGGHSAADSVALGMQQCHESGTVVVGEIATDDWDKLPPVGDDLQLVVFRELLGLDPQRQPELIAQAERHLHAAAAVSATTWQPALSPHAPYTVSRSLLQAAVRLAQAHAAPLAMHVAESPEEMELLASRRGPLRDALEQLGAWYPQALLGHHPHDYLQVLAEAPRVLVIHGNYLQPADWEFLAQRRATMSVIYCPRTHAYFAHPRYPLSELLRAGVRVALGTDSRASNPDLSLFEEMRFVARHYSAIAPEDIVRMGTTWGADALGLSSRYGRVRSGSLLPLTVAELPASSGDAYELLWQSRVRSWRGHA